MNPNDYCGLHGTDGDVCDCRVEPERRPLSGYFLLSNAVAESRWQRHEEEGTHVIGDVSEPVPIREDRT